MTSTFKLLVVGNSGQVARSMSQAPPPKDWSIISMGRPALDILQPDKINAVLDRELPDVIVNAAAYTAVDEAETHEASARRLNATAAIDLARLSAVRNIPIIHISTDYVFDGSKNGSYNEDDAVAPLCVYGQTKLDGEKGVSEANPQHIILRTAWVYSPFGSNFVTTMLRMATTHDELSIVDDQYGNPTSGYDIAAASFKIAKRLKADGGQSPYGVYHIAGAGSATWADFAVEIFAASSALGGPSASVKRIPSSAYPTPVKRPANSRLDCSKIASEFDVKTQDWRQSVQTCVRTLLETNEGFS